MTIFRNIIITAAVAASLGIYTTSCANTTATAQTETPPPAQAFSPVLNPVVPASVSICGQELDLDVADYYERFDRELTSLAYTHGTTLLILKRANRYFPQIAPILRQNGLPEDLVYLACVESSLNPRAVSPAKAAGIWQFMPATAREFGLEVTDEIDERYNIEKATNAACRYFKKSLAKYNGNWMSVMASYNAGMARISNALDQQKASAAIDLYLADETMRYPFRIAAMKTVIENPQAYGFHLAREQFYHPREVKIVEVNGSVDDWAAWAKGQGISYLDLVSENPWIRGNKLTNKNGKTYSVRIPAAETRRRSTARHSLYNPSWAPQ